MKDPLLSLAPSELRGLATAVRNGRVSAPFSALSLQRIIGQDPAVRSGRLAAEFHQWWTADLVLPW